MTTPTAPAQPQPCCCTAAHLTEREITVLCALATGATSGETAATLTLSRRTVDAHVASMLRKACVRNRGELLAVVVAHGIIDMTAGTPAWSGRSCLPAGNIGQATPTSSSVQ